MEAGLWMNGNTHVGVTRVQMNTKIQSLLLSRSSLSFEYVTVSAATDYLFKVKLSPLSPSSSHSPSFSSPFGILSGVSVNVGGKITTGAFLSSEKAVTLYGKDTLESQHSIIKSEDSDENKKEEEREWVICNIGEVESNVSISILLSFVTELSLSPSKDSLRFSLPSPQWIEKEQDKNNNINNYPLDIDVEVSSASPFSLSSPSHPSTSIIHTESHSRVHLSLLSSEEKERGDFVLDITPSSPFFSSSSLSLPSSLYPVCAVERMTRDGENNNKYAIMLSLFSTNGPLPSNLKVNWGGLEGNIFSSSSRDDMSVFYTTVQEGPNATVTLEGDGISSIPFSLSPSLFEENNNTNENDDNNNDNNNINFINDNTIIHQLAARARINELSLSSLSSANKAEIRELGIQAGISAPFSSVFAKNGRVSLLSLRNGSMASSSLSPSSSLSSSSSSSGSSDPVSPVLSDKPARKVYDSKFLLSFRELYTDMPKGLPPVEIILGKEGINKGNNNHNNNKGERGERGNKRRDNNRKQPVNLPPVEPLKQTEGRWLRNNEKEEKTENPVEILRRNVCGLLNKLTLEKFDALSTQISAVKISSFEELKAVAESIFEKALMEQHFCSMYAKLCRKLAEVYPSFPLTNEKNNNTNNAPNNNAPNNNNAVQSFKRLILNMCQKEFEKPIPTAAEITEKMGITEKIEIEETELKLKRRNLGNIRFIGELFKLGLLREAIMHECVTRLLMANNSPTPVANGPNSENGPTSGSGNLPAEEDLEALCKLLKTMGKRLDRPGADRQRMDRYFGVISSLSKNSALPSRSRFMLMDLIDQRKNEWVPRREDKGPQTIAAVHADAEKADRMAKEETAMRFSSSSSLSSSLSSSTSSTSSLSSSSSNFLRSSNGIERDGKERERENGRERRNGDLSSSSEIEKDNKSTKNNDAWEVAGSKNKRGGGGGGFQEVKGSRRDSYKPSNSSSQLRGKDNNTNSRDNNKNNTNNKNKNNNNNNNNSKAQPQHTQGGRKQGGANNNINNSSNHNNNNNNNKKEKENGPQNVFSSLEDEEEEDEIRSSGNTPRASASSAPQSTTSSLTTVQLERRTDALLGEYFAIVDVSEAVESIKELQSPDFHPQIVVRAINMVLEHNKPAQLDQLDSLFSSAFNNKNDNDNENDEALSRGFEEILENIEDLDIDIPMASKHVATLIGSAISRGSLSLSFLFSSLSHLVASGKAEVIVGAALQKIVKESGETKLVEMYDSTQQNLTELFKSGRSKDFIDTFLQSRDLGALSARL